MLFTSINERQYRIETFGGPEQFSILRIAPRSKFWSDHQLGLTCIANMESERRRGLLARLGFLPDVEKMVGDCELRPHVKMTTARLFHIEFHSTSTVTLACGNAHLSIIVCFYQSPGLSCSRDMVNGSDFIHTDGDFDLDPAIPSFNDVDIVICFHYFRLRTLRYRTCHVVYGI